MMMIKMMSKYNTNHQLIQPHGLHNAITDYITKDYCWLLKHTRVTLLKNTVYSSSVTCSVSKFSVDNNYGNVAWRVFLFMLLITVLPKTRICFFLWVWNFIPTLRSLDQWWLRTWWRGKYFDMRRKKGGWRNLYNEEFHSLHSSLNILLHLILFFRLLSWRIKLCDVFPFRIM